MEKTKYNEEVYLSGDPEVLQDFAERRENHEDICLIESVIFPELIKKYDEFVTKIAKLIRDVGYNSSIECSLIISYLIKNGYLSDKASFEWDAVDSETELKSRLGTEIVNGGGCCRHLSSIHKNIFDELGMYFKELFVYHGNNTFFRAENEQANHVISLIDYENVLYGLDIGNNDRLYRFKTPLILRELATSIPDHLRYKPYMELTTGAVSSIEEIQSNLQKYCSYVQARAIHPYDYEANFRQETTRRLHRMEDIFGDFHRETKTLKKEIGELVKVVHNR